MAEEGIYKYLGRKSHQIVKNINMPLEFVHQHSRPDNRRDVSKKTLGEAITLKYILSYI